MERLTTRQGREVSECVKCRDMEECYSAIGCGALDRALNKLAHYEDLEEQGLLLKLHFVKGDVVYEVVEGGDGEHYVVPRKCHTNALLIILNEKVGKTVFLTKAEAEKALAEMEK